MRCMSSRAPAERTRLDRRLRTEPTVWLSSMRPDGRPHVVPVWFSWDGSVFDLFSKPHAQKVRNLREHPDVMLAVGKPDAEWDVELVEGTATVLDAPTAEVVAPTMFEKYAALMARAALDRETFVSTYSQPVRIHPTRFLGYGGRGWTDPALAPDGDDDVSGHLMLPRPIGEAQAALVAELRRVTRRLRRGTAIELLALDD